MQIQNVDNMNIVYLAIIVASLHVVLHITVWECMYVMYIGSG